MTLPKFLDISQTLLQENTLNVHFDGQNAFSFPVLAWREERLVDAMFLYREGNGVPYAWTLLDSASGSTLLMADRSAVDFAPDLVPMENAMTLSLAKIMEPSAYVACYQELYETYEQVRAFAFRKDLTEDQRHTMERYRKLFLQIAYTGHLPYYEALSPEFFRWTGLSGLVPETPQQLAARDGAGEIREGGQGLSGSINALTALIKEKLAEDKRREAKYETLHDELEQYRIGLFDMATEPLERDIIKIIEDISRNLDAHRGKMPTRENYHRFFTLFESVQTDLKDLLLHHGVESYAVPGSKVDLERQQILATTPASSPELDRTVAQRHAKGWEKGGKVIRPERVTAYVYHYGAEEESLDIT